MDIGESMRLLPLWYVVFLLSLTCHEAAHALAARRGGDDTAYLGGQASLNPWPHIRREPFGTVLVPLITFLQAGWMMGWASAPYDPLWEGRHPGRAGAMAAAGPLANLALALVGFVALKAGLASGLFAFPESSAGIDRLVAPAVEGAAALDAAGRLLSILLVLNLVLAVFNAIPLPPMDGASVLAGIVPPLRRVRSAVEASPLVSLGGLVAAWLLFPLLFRPVLRSVLSLLYA